MKVSIAAFKTEYDSIALLDEELNGIPRGWAQLTKFVEVDLPDLQDAVERQIEQIDRDIAKEAGRHFAEIKRLETKKQELLAISYEADAKADALTEDF